MLEMVANKSTYLVRFRGKNTQNIFRQRMLIAK